jgi:hypothetical protein
MLTLKTSSGPVDLQSLIFDVGNSIPAAFVGTGGQIILFDNVFDNSQQSGPFRTATTYTLELSNGQLLMIFPSPSGNNLNPPPPPIVVYPKFHT